MNMHEVGSVQDLLSLKTTALSTMHACALTAQWGMWAEMRADNPAAVCSIPRLATNPAFTWNCNETWICTYGSNQWLLAFHLCCSSQSQVH